MPLPLLAIPAIAAALGWGVQAARGKTSNKDLWKGALMGAGTGAAGAGTAALSPALMSFLGMGGGAASDAAIAASLGAIAPEAAGASGVAGAAGAAGGLGFDSLLGAAGKGAAGSAGSMALSQIANPPQDYTMKTPGNVPQLDQPVDPWLMFQQLKKQGGLS